MLCMRMEVKNMSAKKFSFSIEDDIKKDLFCRLTENIEDADEIETKEVLKEIEAMSDDDLSVVASMPFQI